MPSANPPEQLINLVLLFDPDLILMCLTILYMNVLMVPPFMLQIKLTVNALHHHAVIDIYGYYWQLTTSIGRVLL